MKNSCSAQPLEIGFNPPDPAAYALTSHQFCRRFGISSSVFWQAVRYGHVKVIRLGRATRISLLEVQRLVEDGTALEQVKSYAEARI